MKTFPIHRSLGVLLLFGLFHACAQLQDVQQLTKQMTAMIEPQASAKLFSGIVLVGSADSIIYQATFGYADVDNNVLNHPDTQFGIGSLTKLFTSIITQQLVSEKKINLDDRVEKYIPGFPKGPGNRMVKIGHLLNHRSGIPHRVTDGKEELLWLSAQDMVDKVKETKLLFKPGKQRLYSSAGFTVLARIIEIVEDMPFDKVISERIFDPAQMNASVSPIENAKIENRAASYFLETAQNKLDLAKAAHKNLSYLTGAGSVFTTAEDLFKFSRALKNGIFGTELTEISGDRNASVWRGWAGRTNGYWSYLDVLPSKDLTLIMLTNLGSASNWKLRAQIRNLLSGKATEPIDFPPPIEDSFEPSESLVGDYENNGRIATVTLQNGRLYRGENQFYPITGNQYYTLGSGSVIKFRRNSSGKIDALVQIRGENHTVFRRLN